MPDAGYFKPGEGETLATEAQRWCLLPGDGRVPQAGVPGNSSVAQREAFVCLGLFPFLRAAFLTSLWFVSARSALS